MSGGMQQSPGSIDRALRVTIAVDRWEDRHQLVANELVDDAVVRRRRSRRRRCRSARGGRGTRTRTSAPPSRSSHECRRTASSCRPLPRRGASSAPSDSLLHTFGLPSDGRLPMIRMRGAPTPANGEAQSWQRGLAGIRLKKAGPKDVCSESGFDREGRARTPRRDGRTVCSRSSTSPLERDRIIAPEATLQVNRTGTDAPCSSKSGRNAKYATNAG